MDGSHGIDGTGGPHTAGLIAGGLARTSGMSARRTNTAETIDDGEQPTPRPHDEKDFLVVIPSASAFTPWEQRAAEAGGWPIRMYFPSAEALRKYFNGHGSSGHRGDAHTRHRVTAANESAPSIDAFLADLVRKAVRDEMEQRRPDVVTFVPKAAPATQVAHERLTVPQIAALLGVTAATVREWIKAGDLKASRIGPEGKARIYSVARADLDDFLHRRRVNPVVHDIDRQADEILQTLDTDGGR